jgi:xanthine dehydrogenase accessory factor
MNESLLELALRLAKAQEPFVMATVVWCDRPTSSKPGAQAIIQADGTMSGWIGGSCAHPVVLREALRVLREGDDPYLLRLGASDVGPAREQGERVRVFPMSCASGGILDIYMEPHLPQPHLLLIGDSPVMAALSRLAEVVDFAVTRLSSADLSQVPTNERTYIVVATHGQYDEDALEQALRGPARYVGMVASHRRAEAVREYLRGSGLVEQQIERLKAPAGLDVGAVTPEEIAASILAELVQVRRRGPVVELRASREQRPDLPRQEQAQELEPPAPSDTASTATDPVCGMMVEIATARHHSVLHDRDYYFCCPACKRLFERNPQEYLPHLRPAERRSSSQPA